MNPVLQLNLFPLKFITTAFLLVILLPILAVLVLTQTGIETVSNSLVGFNEVRLTIQIKNPLDGKVVKEITGPFIWPAQGIITLEFGESSIYQPFHTGIDIAGKRGNPVVSFMSGKIISTNEISWGYGKHIIVDNGNNVTSLYAHLDNIYVSKGQDVLTGQILGAEGSTGWSTGPHLHFETRVFGIPVNPRTFLK